MLKFVGNDFRTGPYVHKRTIFIFTWGLLECLAIKIWCIVAKVTGLAFESASVNSYLSMPDKTKQNKPNSSCTGKNTHAPEKFCYIYN